MTTDKLQHQNTHRLVLACCVIDCHVTFKGGSFAVRCRLIGFDGL